ncbi:uncharacterized protein [Hoplias malabaricus]|uniref:uncharacterized protein isoform X5 n=1 Tax=Hoplias malabaricus TaxID=27720 RepID=UPI003462D824
MKKIDQNGNAHLCFFFVFFSGNDIKGGDDVTYDYGGEDCPWRKQSTSVAANNMAEDDSCPSLHSETQMHDATHPNNISSLSTSVAANNVAEDDSCPSLHSETQMHDTTRPNNNSSLVARQLILDMLHDQLSTSIAANNVAEDDSCPSLHSETQMHDTTRPNNNSSLVYRHALLCLNVSCAHLQSSMC